MPTTTPAVSPTTQRARRFARALTFLVKQFLDRLPERELLAYLEEIHGHLDTEL